jgi:hypothetical protein
VELTLRQACQLDNVISTKRMDDVGTESAARSPLSQNRGSSSISSPWV